MTVVIASPNTAVERLLVVRRNRPGEVHRLIRDETLAGGKPVNVARVLGRLAATDDTGTAANPWLAGFLGSATGALAAAALEREGLHGTWVSTQTDTRICEVLVDLADPGGATVYNAPGAPISAAELAELNSAMTTALPTAAALVCAGSVAPGVPVDQYARWVAQAHRHGVPSVLDATGEHLRAAAAAGPTVVKLNRTELLAAATDPNALLRDWSAAGVRAVIITNGGGRTFAVTPRGCFAVTAPDVDVISAVGSGDAFAAGLVHSMLHSGHDWPGHLRAAAACGAANATSVTADLPPEADLARLRARTRVTELDPAELANALASDIHP
ncbi:1-phosphofructokinase family hexose kinase [Saccharopolyspora sp. 5N708]|uniref:1-phosphofructokinase family hexose kinase n=1 Tax=Saccharopolyspora sp. 5N708 TaxID=3457424 RepID=UPI003FD5F357